MVEDPVRTPSGAVVRRFEIADLAAILEMIGTSPEAARWEAKGIQGLVNAGVDIWVADSYGVATGFLAGRRAGPEFEILNLAVFPRHRRQNVASDLLRTALESARTAGCTHVYLEVRASNQAAIALYSRHGFGQCGRRPHLYQQPDEDALVLSLPLKEFGLSQTP